SRADAAMPAVCPAMKINLPVSGRALDLPHDINILSTTDLKGLITYVNPELVETSGFSEEELLGQSHNIVRHPDMPPVAYAQLWKNLQSGRSWMGVVKNRCKNGDHLLGQRLRYTDHRKWPDHRVPVGTHQTDRALGCL